ncbi:spore germination protein GerM [Psychromicrobium silvestre]|uniref:Spore germination protein GerM n=1 Tax=Psychromicrobium silvestre TaxID=1645614 RepID=A0A7Y9LRR1_9MICC|nr:spore germination protein GerM [Psychromicrobium silvestre]
MSLLAALVCVLFLAACGQASSLGSATNVPTNASADVGTAGVSSLETAESSAEVPVYWLGHSNDKSALYREFLPLEAGADPIQAALQLMTSGKPLDPDYSTPWSKASKIAASISANNVITVDISADAFNQRIDNPTAQLAVQELVYTATGAAANAGLISSNQSVQVSILVDGHTDFMAFDQVKLDRTLSRDASVQAPIWIIYPQQGTTVQNGPIDVTGVGPVGATTVKWTVVRVDPAGGKADYQSGTTPVLTEDPNRSFAFSINPPPGQYDLLVYSVDPRQPSVRLNMDSKSFTVK